MLSRDRIMPRDTWNLSGEQGNVIGNPRFDSSQTPYQGILHSTNQSATGGFPVQVCTGKLVARGEERIGSTTPMPMSARRTSTMNSLLPAEILWLHSKDCKYRSFSSIIHHTFDVFMLEDKIQNPGEFLFRFSLGSNVMDQRSGDGRFSG